MELKKCADCKVEKEITQFNSSGGDGRRSECRMCTSKRRLRGRNYPVQKLPPEKPTVPPLSSNPNEICFMGNKTLDDIEREAILNTLKFYKGSRTKTAQHLRIAIRTVTNKIQEFKAMGIEVPEPELPELVRRFSKNTPSV